MWRQEGTNIDFLFVLLQVFGDLWVTKCRDRVLLPDTFVGFGDRETALGMVENLIATDVDRRMGRHRRLDADEEAVSDLEVVHRNIVEKTEPFSMKVLPV